MTESKHDGLAIPGAVVLAHEPPFTIGETLVSPGTRTISRDGVSESLEPKVMQVLVALARTGGEIVTRDELIDRCWNGRVVTDDALNRVLSRLRQVAAGIGGRSFSIETITKVGYRLITALPGREPEPGSPVRESWRPGGTTRRRLIVGAAAAAGMTSAAMLWQRPWRHRPIPEAEELYRRGVLDSREGTPVHGRQAMAYFERAVQIDGRYAEAWGALALCYSHLFDAVDAAEVESLPPRIRGAAHRALELDPDNAHAQLALLFITPYFRQWRVKEEALRRLVQRHPRHWLARGRLAVLLYQVGRLSEGIEHHREALRIDPMLPIAHAYLIRSLTALGRPQEAEAIIEQARQRWPAHPALWSAEFDHLVFGGRPKSAAAFALNPDRRPPGWGREQVEASLLLARALDGRAAVDVTTCLEQARSMAAGDVRNIPDSTPIFVALGRADLAFAALERYYLDKGPFGASSLIGPYTRRYTDLLFVPPVSELHRHRRYGALLASTGLEDYWRQTRTVPDYRRA